MARGFTRGISGDPWHRCQRCDAETRCSQLKWQNGILICSTCWDNPIGFTRDAIIREVMSNTTEEAQVAHILRGESNESEPPNL